MFSLLKKLEKSLQEMLNNPSFFINILNINNKQIQKEDISSINDNGDDKVSDNSETIYMPGVVDKD